MPDTLAHQPKFFSFADRQLDLSCPQVMGVINVTPDSFSDGGELIESGKISLAKALERAAAMVAAGAAIIDVGGESTRPGAAAVSSQEEVDRVLPVVEAIRSELDVVISVDTGNPEIIKTARQSGVGLINDIRALSRDGALQAAVGSGLPVCLMHMQGSPTTMQVAPGYSDVVQDIMSFLEERVQDCESGGLSRTGILLDPGFGFGKTLAHNLELLGRLEEFQALKLPILVGLSRKAMVGKITGKEPGLRMPGSLAAAVIAVMKGASIVRTHDVSETVDAVRVCAAVLRGK